MDIPTSTTGLATLATAMSQTKLESAVDVTVFKKAIDIQKESAIQLIQSLPTPAATLPDGVGGQINTTA
jgi:hypothetical protein